jgi:hypothetical protein
MTPVLISEEKNGRITIVDESPYNEIVEGIAGI